MTTASGCFLRSRRHWAADDRGSGTRFGETLTRQTGFAYLKRRI